MSLNPIPATIVPDPPAPDLRCTTCGNPVKAGETCGVDGTVAPGAKS